MRAGTPQFAKEQFRRNQTAPCFSFGGSMWIERPFAYITLVFLLIVFFASERSVAQSPASDGKTTQDAALAETVKHCILRSPVCRSSPQLGSYRPPSSRADRLRRLSPTRVALRNPKSTLDRKDSRSNTNCSPARSTTSIRPKWRAARNTKYACQA